MRHFGLFFVLAPLMTACGDSSGDAEGTQGPSGAGGATAGAGASSSATTGPGGGGAPAGAVTLVSADWTLDPGTEIYQCTRLTVDEDMYITEFHPVIPKGTHHTVLTLQPAGAPDGTQICGDPFEGGPQQIYGTGVGSQPMKMPPGTAVKISKGQQVHLNLHLFNVGSAPLSGTSAIEVVTTTAAEVQNEAELHIWGKVDGLVVPANQTSTQTGTCTLAGSESTLFILQPHMHQLGKHLAVRHTPLGGAQTTLFDADYSFDAQVHEVLDPMVALAPGDTLAIECTYDNTTPNEVTFGESTKDEMCFAGLWMYPAGGAYCQ